MLFSRTFVASALAAVASAQDLGSLPPLTDGTTTISGAKETAIVQDLVNYLSSVEAQPEFTSVESVVKSAFESEIVASFKSDPTAADFPFPTGTNSEATFVLTSTPSAWLTALPSDVRSYISSVDGAVASIATKDLKGPAPTNKPMAMAAGVAAAGVGVVAMVL